MQKADYVKYLQVRKLTDDFQDYNVKAVIRRFYNHEAGLAELIETYNLDRDQQIKVKSCIEKIEDAFKKQSE